MTDTKYTIDLTDHVVLRQQALDQMQAHDYALKNGIDCGATSDKLFRLALLLAKYDDARNELITEIFF